MASQLLERDGKLFVMMWEVVKELRRGKRMQKICRGAVVLHTALFLYKDNLNREGGTKSVLGTLGSG